MLDIVLLTALIIAVLTFFLCLNQITKRIKKPAEASLPHENTSLFTAYLLRITISALLLFLLFAFLSHYYFDQLHDFFTLASMALISGCFVVFLIFTLLSEKLQRYIDARIDLLRKETMSRLLRHFLYVGALTGIATVLLSAGYTFLVAQQPQMVIDFFLLPIYASALFLFWLRFRVALVARASDYAFELIKRQEAALPLAGEHNPLWKLRLDFAAINRFLFYHLEFFILCVVALLVAGQTEKFIAFTNALSGSMALSVFSIGICAAIPALFIMRVGDKTSPETFLWNIRIGSVVAISIQAILTYFIFVVLLNLHIKYFWIVLIGALTAFFLNVYSATYVAENHKTARGLIVAAASSVSTVVHRGIAVGMRGSAIPALIIVTMMGIVYMLGIVEEKGENKFVHGMYALSLALTSMLSLFAVSQATAAMMPLASSAVNRLKMNASQDEKKVLLTKFRALRSVSVPSFVLHGKVMLSALVVLAFLVYAQILSSAGQASLFKHLMQIAMLLVGGIASYFLSARVNELVLNLGPRLVRTTRQTFRETGYAGATTTTTDMGTLWQTANRYLMRKTLPLFIGTILLPALTCIVGGAHGLTGYLIGFGFLSFLNGNSWLTTGAAWSSARHAAEADMYVTRDTAQFNALVEADMVGDSMHEAVAPILSGGILVTIIASLMFTPATLVLHERLREIVLRFI